MPARQFLDSISLSSGLVTGLSFDFIRSTDFPLSGVTAGEYTLATVRVDEHGLVVSASSQTILANASDLLLVYGPATWRYQFHALTGAGNVAANDGRAFWDGVSDLRVSNVDQGGRHFNSALAPSSTLVKITDTGNPDNYLFLIVTPPLSMTDSGGTHPYGEATVTLFYQNGSTPATDSIVDVQLVQIGAAMVKTANTFFAGPQTIITDADTHVGFIVQANDSTQSADLIQVIDGSSNTFLRASPAGNAVTITPNADANRGLVLKQHSGSQSGSLIALRDSTDTSDIFFLNPAGGIGLTSNSVLINDRAFSWNSSLTFNSACAFTGHSDNTIEFTTAGLVVTQNGSATTLNMRPFSSLAGTTNVYEAIRSHPQIVGTPAAGFGSKISFAGQSSTTNDRDMGHISGVWNVATDASRTGTVQIYSDGAGGAFLGVETTNDTTKPFLGFYGVTPIARALLATGAGHTVDDVITALQNLGLVRQS